MSELIYLYAPVGERIGTFCPQTGRAQIGNVLLAPERICHAVEGRVFPKCSECGETMGYAFRYCSGCGAKVLGGDE